MEKHPKIHIDLENVLFLDQSNRFDDCLSCIRNECMSGLQSKALLDIFPIQFVKDSFFINPSLCFLSVSWYGGNGCMTTACMHIKNISSLLFVRVAAGSNIFHLPVHCRMWI